MKLLKYILVVLIGLLSVEQKSTHLDSVYAIVKSHVKTSPLQGTHLSVFNTFKQTSFNDNSFDIEIDDDDEIRELITFSVQKTLTNPIQYVFFTQAIVRKKSDFQQSTRYILFRQLLI
jgi:hypothetical protein